MATMPFQQALLSRLGTIQDIGQAAPMPGQFANPSVGAVGQGPANYGGPSGMPSGIQWGKTDLRPGKGVARDPISFGKWLQSQGFRVSEHPLFGGVDPVHVKNSRHYSKRAYDVNWAAGTSRAETEMINRILNAARAWGLKTIWQAPGHYNHAHFQW